MTIDKAIKILSKKYKIKDIETAIVAGSGLIEAMPDMENKVVVSYKELGLPQSKVQGHSGNFTFGKYKGKNIVIVSRIHFYESGDMKNVRLPYEIISQFGVKKVILLTSSGGINKTFKVGDIMLINDHINFTGFNPLIGIDKLEFTNMGDCYNLDWRNKIKKIASKELIDLKEGVFVQMSGPSYETKAEIEMLRKLGGDSVSMSTAFDSIICNYLKMNVIGFSIIVNTFSGKDDKLTHQEVLENARNASKNLKKIINQLI